MTIDKSGSREWIFSTKETSNFKGSRNNILFLLVYSKSFGFVNFLLFEFLGRGLDTIAKIV